MLAYQTGLCPNGSETHEYPFSHKKAQLYFSEIWPGILLAHHIDKAYNILLAVVLLLIPMILMSGFYGLMGKKLCLGYSNGRYNLTHM